MVVTPVNTNIFESGPQRNQFLLLFGHQGGNIFSCTKENFEKEHNVKIKELELSVFDPPIGKVKYIRMISDAIHPDYLQHIIYHTIRWCSENSNKSVGILLPRIGMTTSTVLNKIRNVITINRTIETLHQFVSTFSDSGVEVVDLYSLSLLLPETLGLESIKIEPVLKNNTKKLITNIATYLLSMGNDPISKDKIQQKFFITYDQVIEILEKLVELKIITPFNPTTGNQRIVKEIENLMDLKKKIDTIWNNKITPKNEKLIE